MGFFDKIKNGLKKTKENMVKQMEHVFHSFTKIDEELFEELEEILIMSKKLERYLADFRGGDNV